MKFAKSQVFLFSLMALAFSGCQQFKGSMNVYSDFSISNHHILHRTIKYSPGSYETKVTYHPSEEIFEIKSKGMKPVKLKIPQHYIQNNGRIEISGSEVGENWDVVGNFQTFLSESPKRTVEKSCILDSYYLGQSRYIEYGTKTVVEHDVYTTRELKLNFISPNRRTLLADLVGDDQTQETVTDQVLVDCH